MSNKIFFALCTFCCILLLLLFLFMTKGLQFKKMGAMGESMQPPPTSVSTAFAELQSWSRNLRAVGSIEPVQGVRLDAELPGVVIAINFENGQLVNEGAVLVQLDVAPETALLKSDMANAQLAKVELDRAKRLRSTNSVAQSELDRAEANYDIAVAQIKNTEAIIEQKTIRAPFSGRVGIRQINLGQYLSAGAPIVTIQSYDTVFVNFTLPQQTMDRVDAGMQVTLKSDAYPEKTFEGKLTAISPQVDPVMRTIELQGTLGNPEGLLRPGLFVNVTLTLPKSDEVIVIPVTAIVYAPYGNSIYKVSRNTDEKSELPTGTAKQSFVRIGQRRGDFVSILDGLKAGDEVVSAGGFKLRNDAPVSINNEMAPEPELAPNPGNS